MSIPLGATTPTPASDEISVASYITSPRLAGEGTSPRLDWPTEMRERVIDCTPSPIYIANTGGSATSLASLRAPVYEDGGPSPLIEAIVARMGEDEDEGPPPLIRIKRLPGAHEAVKCSLCD